MFKNPYEAILSEEFEEPWIYENGNIGKSKYHKVYVYKIKDNNEKEKIGEYKINPIKRPILVFYPFKRNNHWYALTGNNYNIKILSLPDLNIVAECTVGTQALKVMEAYIPRFHHVVHELPKTESLPASKFHETLIDDDIEANTPDDNVNWEHADFAFIMCYDWYCAGPNFVNIVDLSQIEQGQVSIKNGWLGTPKWLTLKQTINMENWNLAHPFFEMATVEFITSVNFSTQKDDTWSDEQFGNMVPEDER